MKKIFMILALAMIGTFALSAQKVEVKYFHGKQRCITCMSIERLTRELVQECYSKDVKSGKLKLSIIDMSTDSGKKKAAEYKVTFSSLFVSTGKKRDDLTSIGFRYAKNNPIEFKKQLKATIDASLKKR